MAQLIEVNEIPDRDNYLKVAALLSRTDYNTWLQLEFTPLLYEQLALALDWFYQGDITSYYNIPRQLPEFVTINGKKVIIPRDLAIKTQGQFMAFKNGVLKFVQVTEDGKFICNTPSAYADAMAIYLQPEYTGKPFDYDNIHHMVGFCRNLPVTEVMPVAAFFLKKYLRSVSEELQSNIRSQQASKSRRASKTSSSLETST